MIKKYGIEIDISEENFKKINKDFSDIWYYINQVLEEGYKNEYGIKMRDCKELKEI